MFEFKISGDSAIIVSAGSVISEEINLKVRKLHYLLAKEGIKGIVDFIPAYSDLMICYDPLSTDFSCLLEKLRTAEKDIDEIELPPPRLLRIPVLYGGEEGPDLGEVAGKNNLSEKEVIEIHSAGEYLVYMLGFAPGFCYLGGLDKRISTPRKGEPRVRIPAGSVGIAGDQTGIYPVESPGGWQLIGKTPVRLFDPGREPVFLVRAGDYIRFFPIGRNDFESISSEVMSGNYKAETSGRSS